MPAPRARRDSSSSSRSGTRTRSADARIAGISACGTLPRNSACGHRRSISARSGPSPTTISRCIGMRCDGARSPATAGGAAPSRPRARRHRRRPDATPTPATARAARPSVCVGVNTSGSTAGRQVTIFAASDSGRDQPRPRREGRRKDALALASRALADTRREAAWRQDSAGNRSDHRHFQSPRDEQRDDRRADRRWPDGSDRCDRVCARSRICSRQSDERERCVEAYRMTLQIPGQMPKQRVDRRRRAWRNRRILFREKGYAHWN